MTKADAPGEITIRDPTVGSTERVTLQRIEPTEAKETLGIHIAFDGTWLGEYQHLLDKAKSYADHIRNSGLDKGDALYSLKSVIFMTFKYPLAAISLTKKQWEKIMKVCLEAGLPKSGIARNFPNVAIYAPLKFQGLDIFHLYDAQNLEQIFTLVDHCNRNTITGNLISLCYQSMILELGIPGACFSHSYDQLQHCVTTSWIKSLWKYCWDRSLTIHNPVPMPPLMRTNDRYLMDVFYQSDSFTPRCLERIKTCMHFLRVFTVSDIATASGKRLRPGLYWGKRDSNALNKLDWPRQPPSLGDATFWEFWQQALDTCIIHDDPLRKLQTPLGSWRENPWNFCPYLVSVAEERLYCRQTNDSWDEYKPLLPFRVGRTFQLQHRVQSLPEDAAPANARNGAPNHLIFEGFDEGPVYEPPLQYPDPTNYEAMRLSMTEQDLWAVEHILSVDQGSNFATSIQEGTARAVSDGSYKEGKGSSAYILCGSDETLWVRGLNRSPGAPDIQCPYRSETCGVLGILINTTMTVKLHQVPSGEVEIGFDGESVISKLESEVPIKPSAPHYDLLLRCHEEIKTLRSLHIGVKLRHIMGHADDKKGAPLDWWEQRNVEMDTAAKDYLFTTWDRSPQYPFVGNNVWQLAYRGLPQSRVNKTYLYEQFHSFGIRTYWEGKHKIPHRRFHNINWKASKAALLKHYTGKRRWLTKQATGFAGTGRMMRLRRSWAHSNCPRCAATNEKPAHVLSCPSLGARATWHEGLDALDVWMTKVDTDPDLQSALMSRLRAWPRPPMEAFETPPSSIRQALYDQDKLGWYNFLLGRISLQFSSAQDEHYQAIDSQRTGQSWTTQLITELYKITWSMWEHRNFIRHNQPHPDWDPQGTGDLLDRLAWQWDLGPSCLLADDKALFRNYKKAELRDGDPDELALWLEQVQMARDQALKAVAGMTLDGERAGMRRWLIPLG